ncbi:MAG: hypothetical protein Q8P36_02070 [bacterium]|nr:hypothetical protein [bacterium]
MSVRTVRARIVRISHPASGLVARALEFNTGNVNYYATCYQYAGQQLFGPDDGVEVIEDTGKAVNLPYWFVVNAVLEMQAREARGRMRAFLLDHKDWFRNPAPVSV